MRFLPQMFLLTLLWGLYPCAALADFAVRRKEPDVFDVTAPRQVLIRFTEGVQDPEYGGTIGGGLLEWVIADAINRTASARRSERHQADLAALDEVAPSDWIAAQLQAAVRTHLAGAEGVDSENLRLQRREAETSEPQAAGEALVLSFNYRFSDFFRELHVTLDAEVIGQDAKGKPYHRFNQRLYFTTPAPKLSGLRKQAERNMEHWRRDGGRAFREALDHAPNELLEMLAFDLPLEVKRDRMPGKQHLFADLPHVSNYGVSIREAGGRQWLRLRSGLMASVPLRN